MRFDAILIPGGGVRPGGVLPPWADARVSLAASLYQGEYLIALSGGTPHRPPPLDEAGFPIFESVAAARRLRELGIPQNRILTETASYDTIGNAYFARVIHTDPAGFRSLAVVTSEFHMPRVERIFQWVFALDAGERTYQLTFFPAQNAGLNGDTLALRRQKERDSVEQLELTMASLRDLKSLQNWLFLHHSAYAAGRRDPFPNSPFHDTY
ncbi:MAG: YdcF family protein [Bryobacteraceae bacterium]|nr:YdcF family protein [Bryobacteraceae bacterium]